MADHHAKLYGYGISTPQAIQVFISPAATLAAGSYVGEILFTSAAEIRG